MCIRDRKAIVEEEDSKAAAPRPANITATPIFVKKTTVINLKKFILVIPAAKVKSSANPGTGLDIIKPIILRFFVDSSALFRAFSPTMNFAIGLPKNLAKKYPKSAAAITGAIGYDIFDDD